jgi:hypothetical protein
VVVEGVVLPCSSQSQPHNLCLRKRPVYPSSI